MDNDQNVAPILDAIRTYQQDIAAPFTTPGHKIGRGIDDEMREVLGASTFAGDIPELGGMDDRHMSKEVLSRAEGLAAKAFGSDQTMFSVNGSSLSAHTMLLTVAGPGEKVVIARNTHKSAVAALVLAGLIPVWLHPPVDEDLNVHHGPTAGQVEDMLTEHPDARGVFIVSPTYYGTVPDIRSLADVCHRHGVPLIVDEAWGPHFAFHSALPTPAIQSGADMSCGSVHKIMTGVQQASVINVKKGLIDTERLALVFDLFETTSPTTLILGSIDGSRRQMAVHGEEIWGQVLEQSRRARAELSAVAGLRVLGREVLERPEVVDLDETKLVVDVRDLGVTGIQAADWMAHHCHVTVELADQRRIMALLSAGDNERTVDLLITSMREMADWAREQGGQGAVVPSIRDTQTDLAVSPATAFFGPTRRVDLAGAEGEVAAEMLSPYPPGIPAITPGERYTRPLIQFLQDMMAIGYYMPDASDPTLKTVRVVR